MKTIFITGATSGIGKATAETFAKQGHRLIICGRRKEVLEQLQIELSNITEVYSLVFDVRNRRRSRKCHPFTSRRMEKHRCFGE